MYSFVHNIGSERGQPAAAILFIHDENRHSNFDYTCAALIKFEKSTPCSSVLFELVCALEQAPAALT